MTDAIRTQRLTNAVQRSRATVSGRSESLASGIVLVVPPYTSLSARPADGERSAHYRGAFPCVPPVC